jgi:predicted extracellular nuclease
MRFITTFAICLFGSSLFSQTTLTIPQIQGSSSTTSYSAVKVKTSGIVTAKFIGTGKINGYFLQDPVGDGNPLTSDAIFVSTTTDNITIGDKIEITATVSESSSRTQLGTITNQLIISSNNQLPITSVQYNADAWNWEQYEGMLLQFNQPLYVTSNYNLQQYGQLSLNPTRVYNPTNQFLPGSAEYTSLVAKNKKAKILLDDGITTANYTPITFADANGTRRTGERLSNLRAVVDQSGAAYVIYPAEKPSFYGNPRPTAPTELGNYNLKVCTFNLEYYLADSYGQGYGANDAAEAAKQHTKIMAALLAIDADIFGLVEIQQGQQALINIVNALNTATVAGRFAYINDGGAASGTYTKVGYVYRTDKVKPYLNLKNNDNPSPYNRKKAQAFTMISNNERFVFAVNHFKAKSGCASASGNDIDQKDGQSCYNATRVLEATSTNTFLNFNKTYYGDEDVLIMGDLNAYGKEDPIQTLIQAKYTDMHRYFHADSAYSYVYNDEAGYLDHALASDSMRRKITGVSVFHINSDEPTMFEYSGNAYQPNMYRCSDHDPVVVGLSLGSTSHVDNSLADLIKISPAGVVDYFMVSNANNLTIQLISATGKILKQEKMLSNPYRVDVKGLHLKVGVYFVRVLGVDATRRFVVVKGS